MARHLPSTVSTVHMWGYIRTEPELRPADILRRSGNFVRHVDILSCRLVYIESN